MHRSIASTCGQLLVAGFDGTTLPPRFARALARGERGGAILFRRNVPEDVAAVSALTRAVRDAAPDGAPPLVAVDQEGGRVARLRGPVLALPPMRALGASAAVDATFARRVARVVGRELAALGFTLCFAPVLDVDSRPDNPVIGDRAFSASPARVAELGVAWAEGLEAGGVRACGKHFPGHGDTTVDSHVGLPELTHDRARLDAVELAPFRAAAAAGMSSWMTAHVIARALDPTRPATLSYEVCTRLLREELGFRGVLFSDDLEMGALAGVASPEEAAVLAVEAGCDAVLVCAREDVADAAHAALVHRAERDVRFRARGEEAARRVAALRSRSDAPDDPRAALTAAAAEARAVRDAIAGAVGSYGDARPLDPTRDGTTGATRGHGGGAP